jgi:hypothetical protein
MTREKIIERLMVLTWDSLQSHLDGAYLKTDEGKAFHIRCIREYSEMISLLSKLY